MNQLINNWINQATNQPTNPSIHPSIHQSFNQIINQCIIPLDITWERQQSKRATTPSHLKRRREKKNACNLSEQSVITNTVYSRHTPYVFVRSTLNLLMTGRNVRKVKRLPLLLEYKNTAECGVSPACPFS